MILRDLTRANFEIVGAGRADEGSPAELARRRAEQRHTARREEAAAAPVPELPPARPAPPIAERPQCPACSKHLRPVMEHHYARDGGYETTRVVRKTWSGRYSSYGAFCTLTCCEAYANAMFTRHGTTFVLVAKEPT